mgnify:CR=1 FL=1
MSWVFISLGTFSKSTAQVLHDLQVVQPRTGGLDLGGCTSGISGPAIVRLVVRQESRVCYEEAEEVEEEEKKGYVIYPSKVGRKDWDK